MTIPRLTAEERKLPWFTCKHWSCKSPYCPTGPAMGTLEQRLDIIIRRQGGRTRLGPMTKADREAFEAARLPDASESAA